MKSFLFLLTFISIGAFAQSPYQDDHVLVKFNWRYLDLDVIDDQRIESLPLGKLLNEEGLEIIHNSGGDFLLDNNCRKIFGFLKTTDTVSYGRVGNKVRIPTFWSWFNLTLDHEMKIGSFCSRTLDYKPLVLAAHPNWGEARTFSIPDDSLFFEQHSLTSTTFPNAHIDLDSVWNITTGKPWVKVGVYDTAIDTSHSDLDVLGGKGFFFDASSGDIPWWGEPVSSHGTNVAGIIGARRNNEIGVAGIAGGDGTDSTGCSLIDFTILPSTGFDEPWVDYVCTAIIDGARDVGTYYDWSGFTEDYANAEQGWGLWLANHSYAFYITQLKIEDIDDPIIDNPTVPFSACQLCIEAYLFSNENNVTNVAARGNIVNPEDIDAEYGNDELWPQTYPDHMIISVGGSSYDGNRWAGTNTSAKESGYYSQRGRDIDLIAPATDSIIRSTRISYLEAFDTSGLPISDYSGFAGTSAAAPHVTGTLALLLSYYNKPCYSNYNLANEDMEKMLEKSAVDVHAPGYDEESGHGRLNAFNLFDSLYRPYYQVVHPDSDVPVNYTISVVDTVHFYGKTFLDVGPYSDEDLTDPNIFNNAEYKTVLYRVDADFDFSSFLTSPTTEVLDSWMRINTSTFATPQEDSIPEGIPPSIDTIKYFRLERYGEKTGGSGSTISLTGYLYHFIELSDAGFPVDVWYPTDTSNFHFDYSVYLRDTVSGLNFDWPCDKEIVLIDTLAGIDESTVASFKVFPNPFNSEINVTSNQDNFKIIKYRIVDIRGRTIQSRDIMPTNWINIPTNELNKGFYLLEIETENQYVEIHKILKQ